MGPTKGLAAGLIGPGSFATTTAGAAPISNNDRPTPSTLTSCNFASRFRCSVGSTFGSSIFGIRGRNSLSLLPTPALVTRFGRPVGRALDFGIETGGAVAGVDFAEAPESPEFLLEI